MIKFRCVLYILLIKPNFVKCENSACRKKDVRIPGQSNNISFQMLVR